MNPLAIPPKRRIPLLIAVLLLPSVSAQAQWIGQTQGLDYGDAQNWKDGVINDRFEGPYLWPSAQGVNNNNQFSFAEGATTVSTGNFNAHQLVVGQVLSGAGIAAGTVITAINDAGSISIDLATTAASSGNYSVAALNNPWHISIEAGERNLANGFTYRNEDPASVRFTPNNPWVKWNFTAPNSVITVDMGQPDISRQLEVGASSRQMTWDFMGNRAHFDISPELRNFGQTNSVDQMILFADMQNVGELVKTGGGSSPSSASRKSKGGSLSKEVSSGCAAKVPRRAGSRRNPMLFGESA